MYTQIEGSDMRRWVPRFRIRTLLIGTAFIAMLMPAIISQLRLWLDADGQGVIVMGDASRPNDEVIRNMLRQSGQRLPSSSPDVYQEKIADYVDTPFHVPLIGKFQRRHRHYKCGLQSSDNPGSLPSVVMKRDELCWVSW